MIPLRALKVNESGVMDSFRAGADLITYSGDKMLGGPQAGLLSGRESLKSACAPIRSSAPYVWTNSPTRRWKAR